MKLLKVVAVLLALATFTSAEECVERAKVAAPPLSEAARATHQKNLTDAEANYQARPNADNLIWVARRQGYLGLYKEAIKTLSDGARQFPNDARIYRHRGHRYITLRCIDDAIRDLGRAAQLIKNKPDEIEPDGLPNARNIPTSTLQSNIWYHLGLAYYLKGDLKRALNAYNQCEKVSKNPDMLVATKHWQYMTLRRLGRHRDAAATVADMRDDLDIIENDDYHKLVRLYRGTLKVDELMKEIDDANTLGSASLGYGLGNWFLYNGDREKAIGIFKRITAGNQWASFGYITAEVEIKRQKPDR